MTMTTAAHESHPDIVNRLKRAEGHLRSIIAMIEAGRPCLDVAQQMHAVEKAVQQAKRTFIQDHIDHCLELPDVTVPKAQRQAFDEFKAIAKYL